MWNMMKKKIERKQIKYARVYISFFVNIHRTHVKKKK